ncbi:MAG TPA: MmcQ/YjbR family DNA-binding protein [Bryobacteraceae bacterium]
MAKEIARTKVGPAPKLDNGAQLARLQRICTSIPGTIEKVSHGEPTFFTPKRVFAMFANNHHADGHVAVWLPATTGAQAALIEEAPETYFRPPYVGVRGWVGVELSKVDDEQLGALIREAFRLIDMNDAASRRSKPPQPARAQKRGSPRARKT